jgi:hypothetical protein
MGCGKSHHPTLVASVATSAAASWENVSHGHCLLGVSRTVTSSAVSTAASLGVVVATTASESAAAAAAGALTVVS